MAPVASFVSNLPGAAIITFKAAYYCLISKSEESTFRALDLFLRANISALKKCYDPFDPPSEESSKQIEQDEITLDGQEYVINEKLRSDAKKFSTIVNLDEVQALRIVLRFNRLRISFSEKLTELVAHYYSERRYLIQIVGELFRLKVDLSSNKHEIARKYAIDIQVDQEFLEKTLAAIRLKCLEPLKVSSDETHNVLLARQTLLEQEKLLQLIWRAIVSATLVSSQFVEVWYETLKETAVFAENYSLLFDPRTSTIDLIQSYVVIISLLLFNLDEYPDLSEVREVDFQNPKTLKIVNDAIIQSLTDISIAQPICFAWTIYVLRIHSICVDDDFTIAKEYEEIIASFFSSGKVLTIAREVANKAVEEDFLSTLIKISKTLPDNIDYASVLSSFLAASSRYLVFNNIHVEALNTIQAKYFLLIDKYLEEPDVIQNVVLLQNKFPISFSVFIRLLRSFGIRANDILLNMHSYMQQLPRGFRDYDTDAKDPTKITLLSRLCLYEPREEDGEGGIYIPPGTTGELIPNESNLFIVIWHFSFNGWAFLGRVLEHAAKVFPTDELVQEIITLLVSTLKVLDADQTSGLLEAVSSNLQNLDVVEVIGRVWIEAMQNKNVCVSVACANFFSLLIPVHPNRVWIFIQNSNLLERNGQGGMAAYLLSSVEIISGDYGFSLAIIDIARVLVKDAVVGKFSKLISPEIKSTVLLHLVRHLANIYESFQYWKYENLAQRLEIGVFISNLFSDIIEIVYGLDQASEGKNKINGVLFAASQLILDRFLVVEGKNLRCLQPLIGAIETSTRNIDALTIGPELIYKNHDMIHASLNFASTLTKVRSLIRRPPSQLERKLFALTSVLSNLFVQEDLFHAEVLKLLNSLVIGIWIGEEPPSLLAHLGTNHSFTLVAALTCAIESELEDMDAQAEIAKFLSAVFSNKQQGFSILLLSGKEMGKETKKDNGPSLIEFMKTKATVFEKLPAELSVEVLESIALAQNTWAKSVFDSKKNQLFLDKVFTMVERGSVPITGNESNNDVVQICYRSLLAARAVQLCAVQIHKSGKPTVESKEIVKHFLAADNLITLTDNAFRMQGYRASLHGHLHRNFDKKWPQTALIRFQKTGLLPKQYGSSYKYDLKIMDDIFSTNFIWAGYRSEIVQANLNLSLIDSQSHLFRAWYWFIAALIEYSDHEPELFKQLERIALLLLQINIDEGIMAPLFYPIVNERSALAFIIIQKLHSVMVTGKQKFDFKKILNHSWTLISSVDVDFARAMTEGKHELYRPLLRILLVCIRALKITEDAGAKDAEIRQLVSSILENVVSQAFSILPPTALEVFATTADPSNASKEGVFISESGEDLLLVSSLLRDCLNLGGSL
ncbi:nucleoporin subcomplex protein binding to Pom34-domain-containing protein [Lipomyces japonicus]|uniref:nucleoporin subcomplex protein binding to Pom34-domain-containing protein n=1 Tax=Lipomyces japonicus TaxID=56871 RepID=UPI0034CF152A